MMKKHRLIYKNNGSAANKFYKCFSQTDTHVHVIHVHIHLIK